MGGLNEYGIAAYKTVNGFASAEVEFILSIGGITVDAGKALGRDFTLAELRARYDAVFIGIGLAGVNALGLPEESLGGVADAVAYIAELRQADDLAALPVGRKVVVVGGGMTAIDIATQTRRWRRGRDRSSTAGTRRRWARSEFERELAQTRRRQDQAQRRAARLIAANGRRHRRRIEYTAEIGGKLSGTGETFVLDADMVFKAIGQQFVAAALNGSGETIALEAGRIKVDGERRTSLAGVWAGGDCIAGGKDSTVAAVEDGKVAAESIHRALAA